MVHAFAVRPFSFGVYGGSIAGTPSGLAIGSPDSLPHIEQALAELCGTGDRLHLRAYLHFSTNASRLAPPDAYTRYFADLLVPGRSLDLVLCFHDAAGDMPAWRRFIAAALDRFGPQLSRLQITEEPNLRFGTGAIDGDYPDVISALVGGVIFAKSEIRRRELATEVGFSVAPNFGPAAANFWPELNAAAQRTTFVQDLDYVGLDCFPDVFRRTAAPGTPGDLASSVLFLLEHFRTQDMAEIGLPQSTPIVITENGWPTGPDRSEEEQASALETIVRTAGYQWFSLRDADTAKSDIFYGFGLLHSDYSPKSAFTRFRDLIAELQLQLE